MRRSPRSLLAWSAALLVAAHHHRRRLQRSGNPAPPGARSRRAASGARRRARSPARCHARRDRRARDLALRVRDPRRTPCVDVDDAVGRVVAVPVLAGSVLLEPHLTERDRDGLSGLVPIRVPGRTSPSRRRAAAARRRGRRRARRRSIRHSSERREGQVVARAARVLAVEADDDALADGAGVTLLVTEDEARGLAFAAANGVLTLALAPPEDACCR